MVVVLPSVLRKRNKVIPLKLFKRRKVLDHKQYQDGHFDDYVDQQTERDEFQIPDDRQQTFSNDQNQLTDEPFDPMFADDPDKFDSSVDPEKEYEDQQKKKLQPQHSVPQQAKYQRPAPPKKSISFYLVAGIALVLLLICSGIFVYSLQQPPKPTAATHKKPTVVFKSIPKQRKNVQQVSQDKASANVKESIDFAFSLIAKTKATSGEGMDLTQLTSSQTNELNQTFTSSQVLQDFNDIVNLSGDTGSQTYGDAGTGMHTVKQPKAGVPYRVDDESINYVSSTSDNYRFDVALKYHAVKFKKHSIQLIYQVNKGTGKITQVVQKID